MTARPPARTVPVSLLGDRTFKIDNNAAGAFFRATGMSLQAFASTLRKISIRVATLGPQFTELRGRIFQADGTQADGATRDDLEALSELDIQISTLAGEINPDHATAAIWAALQHQWIGQEDGSAGIHERLTVERVGAALDPHYTATLLQKLLEAMQPPDGMTVPDNGSDPLMRPVQTRGGSGPSPASVSDSPTATTVT